MEGYFTVALTENEKANLRKAYSTINSLCQMAVGQNKIKVCGHFYTFDELIKMRTLCEAGVNTTPSTQPSASTEEKQEKKVYDNCWELHSDDNTRYHFVCNHLTCDACPYDTNKTGVYDCTELTEYQTYDEMMQVREKYEI